LGAFTKLRKTSVSFVMSVRSSVRVKQLGSHWTDFHDIWHLSIFRKSVDKPQVSSKSGENTLHESQYVFLIISRSLLLRMRNVSNKNCRENQTHILLTITFFRKSYRLRDNVEKYCRTWQGTWQYSVCALRVAYLWLQHTLKIRHTYCFSTATMVARTRLIVMLYAHPVVKFRWHDSTRVSSWLFLSG
jgi:hypothetical protein